MRRCNWIAAVVVLVLAAAALADSYKMPIRNLPVRGGSNDPMVVAPVAPEPTHSWRGTLDSIGTVYEAGNTYYDAQHNGTTGKMIGVDEMGFVHVVWMKGSTSDNNGPRHVYYNLWDPALADSTGFTFLSGGVPSGVVIDAAQRGGYICMALLPNGWVFPGFHIIMGGDPNAHAAGAIDLMPGMGIFNTTRPAYLYESGESLELIWPKIAVGKDSIIHMISTENPASGQAGDWQRLYYSRGHPTWDQDGLGVEIVWEPVDGVDQFMKIDTVMDIAADIIASQRSDRVAIAWARPRSENLLVDSLRNQYNNDIFVMISEDAGLNWGPVQDITHFAYPDLDCVSGDTLVCDKDTFRAYTDCNVLFDRCDYLHVAFTTRYYWELEGTISRSFSDIWHWGEEYGQMSNITRGLFHMSGDTAWNSYWMDCGAWQVMVQRPSLAEDSVTGYLYCAYQRYDSNQVSEAGWPPAEAYLAVSRNCGRTWSAGTDVTSTFAEVNAPAGECMEEREITIANNVTYSEGEGYVHMFYVFDGDAGTPLQDEGAVTLNPVRYQRIPISAIPATPINPDWQLYLHADSSDGVTLADPEAIITCTTDGVGEREALLPETFRLYQNYPNPFNPITNIQFDLARDAKVTLKVFNVLGQEVATLFDGQSLHAGVQTATFDASALASGVYMYRLDANGVTATRKMILMK